MIVGAPDEAPYITASVRGTGGSIKREPGDFVVEEIPAYEPSGAGEHVYLKIEKRGIPTLDAVERLARALDVPRSAIGYAGLKDARALTVQWISIQVPRLAPGQRIDVPSIPCLTVLEQSRHKNKLKLGHLRGNRFRVRIRDVVAGADALARESLGLLERKGMPNWFTEQRFGSRGDTHRLGRALLANDGAAFFEVLLGGLEGSAGDAVRAHFARGEIGAALAALPHGARYEHRALVVLDRSRGDAVAALRGIDRTLRRLYLSAVQSECFNAILARRFDSLGELLIGDLAWLHRNGACFRVEEPATEQARADSLEISPSGPLFGSKCTRPGGRPGEIEDEVLAASGLSFEAFAARPEIDGARRPLRVPVKAGVVGGAAGTLDLEIELPPGSYATAVLREVMKGGATEVDAIAAIEGSAPDDE